MRARSLSTRLLISSSIVLLLFFGVTVLVFDAVYRNLSESFIGTRLDLQVANLISASDEEPGGRLLPRDTLSEARYATVGSGLYAQIERDDGDVMWWSHSLTDTQLQLTTRLAAGKRQTRRMRLPDGSEVQALSVGLEWQFPRRKTYNFIYTVAEDLKPYRAELQHIRQQLFGWFAGLMALLLVALAILLRWVLRPVRQVEQEIEAIEAGRANELHGDYPRELAGITANMNALLRAERERLVRYRDSLGNLAHSLKTPLAVARSLASTPQLQEQITRMDEIVRYQLKRAAMSGGTGLGNAPVDVKEIIEPLCAALTKVYAERRLDLQSEIEPNVRYVGDKGDLMEIAGNLLDNACKWCRKQVKITVRTLITPGTRREGIVIAVEDDGSGIAADQRERVLKRGARLDERVSGQGIGLSVVHEIAHLSGGGVEIDTSVLGGCKITVRLPAP